jgi:hypothetical protein
MVLSTETHSLQQGLTRSALFDFFCSDGKNVEDLNHYCHDRVHHSLIWRHPVHVSRRRKKCFYALEHLKKGDTLFEMFERMLLVRANVLTVAV